MKLDKKTIENIVYEAAVGASSTYRQETADKVRKYLEALDLGFEWGDSSHSRLVAKNDPHERDIKSETDF